MLPFYPLLLFGSMGFLLYDKIKYKDEVPPKSIRIVRNIAIIIFIICSFIFASVLLYVLYNTKMFSGRAVTLLSVSAVLIFALTIVYAVLYIKNKGKNENNSGNLMGTKKKKSNLEATIGIILMVLISAVTLGVCVFGSFTDCLMMALLQQQSSADALR